VEIKPKMDRRLVVVSLLAYGLALTLRAQEAGPAIPRTWDEQAIAALEVPLANAAFSPRQITSDYYYRMPVRPIYKTYPVYPPGAEPEGYIDWLRTQEPEVVFDAAALRTEEDWIRAGELVFDAPVTFEDIAASPARFPEFYAKSGVRLAADGTLPYKRYVVRKKGVVEMGNLACGQCHTRVMPDGVVIKGAQGNFPEGHFFAARPRRLLAAGRPPEDVLARVRVALRQLYGAPWIQPPPEGEAEMPLDDILRAWEASPPGVAIRQGTSLRHPAQVPDLIGVKDRQYLDHTGLVRHRSIGDLMRYAALNQGAQDLASYGGFVPVGRGFRDVPEPETRSRYSDEQLYALAMYLYSLKPPPNPNRFDALAARGEAVFTRERCARCHTPPLYTNNRLTPAEGFAIPAGHAARFDLMRESAGTDPNATLHTRRGTGYYKVPSLKGVWYRGPFQHNGAIATLEEWFDARRLATVGGHKFGLALTDADTRALIAFLRTL
jgi:hypothetical protein